MSTVTLEFLAEQIGRLIGAVDDLRERIGSLETRVGALEAKVGALEAKVGALEAKVDAVEARVGGLESEIRGLRADHEALDRRVREMTADGKLSLAFLARQMDRVLDEQGRLRDDLTVVSGMVMRLEGTVHGLTVEVRGEHSRYDRLAREVARLRETAPG